MYRRGVRNFPCHRPAGRQAPGHPIVAATVVALVFTGLSLLVSFYVLLGEPAWLYSKPWTLLMAWLLPDLGAMIAIAVGALALRGRLPATA